MIHNSTVRLVVSLYCNVGLVVLSLYCTVRFVFVVFIITGNENFINYNLHLKCS
jgi:hypothetical protein